MTQSTFHCIRTVLCQPAGLWCWVDDHRFAGRVATISTGSQFASKRQEEHTQRTIAHRRHSLACRITLCSAITTLPVVASQTDAVCSSSHRCRVAAVNDVCTHDALGLASFVSGECSRRKPCIHSRPLHAGHATTLSPLRLAWPRHARVCCFPLTIRCVPSCSFSIPPFPLTGSVKTDL